MLLYHNSTLCMPNLNIYLLLKTTLNFILILNSNFKQRLICSLTNTKPKQSQEQKRKHTYSHTLRKKGLSDGMQVNRKQSKWFFFFLRREKRCLRYGRPAQAGGSDKTPGPACPMVPCLLSTKTPHWEAPVSKWERSGAVEVCRQVLWDPADSVTDRAGDPDIETPVEGWF